MDSPAVVVIQQIIKQFLRPAFVKPSGCRAFNWPAIHARGDAVRQVYQVSETGRVQCRPLKILMAVVSYTIQDAPLPGIFTNTFPAGNAVRPAVNTPPGVIFILPKSWIRPPIVRVFTMYCKEPPHFS